MGNKLYKPKNKRKKENLKMIDRLEISGVTIAAIALLGWSGYSIANTFIPQPETPVYEVNVDSVSIIFKFSFFLLFLGLYNLLPISYILSVYFLQPVFALFQVRPSHNPHHVIMQSAYDWFV